MNEFVRYYNFSLSDGHGCLFVVVFQIHSLSEPLDKGYSHSNYSLKLKARVLYGRINIEQDSTTLQGLSKILLTLKGVEFAPSWELWT